MKLRSVAILIITSLLAGFVPAALAAAPNNSNIQVGSSTTNSVPNLFIEVTTTSSTVSATVKIAGSAQDPDFSGSAGSYIVGSIFVVKSPGNITPSVHSMSVPYNSANVGILTGDTGVDSVQGAPQAWQGGTNLGTSAQATKELARNAPGGGSGDAALCYSLRYYFATNQFEDIWYCSGTFVWPEAPDTTAPNLIAFGAFAPTIQADGTTLRVTFGEGMSAATSPSGFVLRRNGVGISMTAGNIVSGGTSLEFTLATPVNSNDGGLFTLFYTQGSVADDAPTPNLLANFSNVSVANNSTLGSGGAGNPGSNTEPTQYMGPEFSGLSAKGIMAGTSPRLEGKNLDEISSIEIGGKAATFKLDGDSSLNLSLPAGLAPGVYDLVVNSAAGKLTHLRAIEVKESTTPTSFTTTTVGLGTEPAFQKHRDFAATQHSSLNKARCVVNASSLVTAELRAKRLCALVGFSNANLKTFVIEARSTVTSDAIYARVHYGIDQ